MEATVPQIPNFADPPSKKSRGSTCPYDSKSKSASASIELMQEDVSESESAFVSQLLGPLNGNLVESPPTPAPVYAAGTLLFATIFTKF